MTAASKPDQRKDASHLRAQVLAAYNALVDAPQPRTYLAGITAERLATVLYLRAQAEAQDGMTSGGEIAAEMLEIVAQYIEHGVHAQGTHGTHPPEAQCGRCDRERAGEGK